MHTNRTSRWRRGAVALVVVLAGLAAVPTGPAGAALTADPEDWGARRADRTDRSDAAPLDPPSTQIVGGAVAPAGAYPTQAALVFRGSDPVLGQFCGGTVVARSWILTAAHCVNVPQDSWYPTPSEIDVLVGTQDLRVGGTRIRVEEIRVHPQWDAHLIRNDIALLRLDRPVPSQVPVQALARPGAAAPAPGTPETVVGWGDLADDSGTYPPDLRQVDLQAQAQSTCAAAFPAGFFSATASICGWGPDRGACHGDSGGPVFFASGIQVGVVSYGMVCGDDPSVFARVSTFSGWIAEQVRYGPHSDANAFVDHQYRDLFGRPPTAVELFTGVVDLQAGQPPDAFVAGLLDSTSHRGRSGGVIRLYQAIFLRTPDSGGLTFWMGERNRGVGLIRIADRMVATAEFGRLYGELDSAAFVDRVYENVLRRDPSPADMAFWVGELDSGRRTRGHVMVGFSESAELKGATAAKTVVVADFHALLRRVPTDAELSTWTGRSTIDVARFLLASWTYANRF